MKYSHYNLLAELFKYPSLNLIDKAVQCHYSLKNDFKEAAEILNNFVNFLLRTPFYTIEEVYTKTFYIQAICYLDLGYVMFGEDYKRGEFLVNMKREQQNAENDCGNELPDNLVNVLTLIPKLKDKVFLDELAGLIIIPCLRKMLTEFDASRIALKTELLKKKHKAILQENLKDANIYQYVLKSLLIVIEKDFENIHFEEQRPVFSFNSNPFITNCSTCTLGKHSVNI